MTRDRFRYREDLTYADSAFEAEGDTAEELFRTSADALTQLMVEDLDSIESRTRRQVRITSASSSPSGALSGLLRDFLDRIIYWKDVDQLLLRARKVLIHTDPAGGSIELDADLEGEPIDPTRHSLGTDVKAVTFHRLRVWQADGRWKALVVVDT